MISPIVLAGGASRRFGTDKSLLDFGGKPLIAWVTSVLFEFGELIISISSEKDITKFDGLIKEPHRFVIDEHKNIGSVAGLLSSVKHAENEFVAVAPCDTPFVNKNLFDLLYNFGKNKEGAVPRVNGFWEPLVAVYRTEPLIKLLSEGIESNRIKLSSLCENLNITEITEVELENHDIDQRVFFNINSSVDLEKAREYITDKH